jgi:hypothetical protein
MPESKRRQLATILNNATLSVGAAEIFRLSDMTPPVFANQSLEDYYQVRFDHMRSMLQKHQKEIANN